MTGNFMVFIILLGILYVLEAVINPNIRRIADALEKKNEKTNNDVAK